MSEKKSVNYKNWVPKGMVCACAAITIAALLCSAAIVLFIGLKTAAAWAVFALFLAVFVFFGAASAWCFAAYNAFSYTGKRQLSRRIIEKIASYVVLPEGGTGLDVGCGSGALTIACAKKNPGAFMVGIDRWGKEYASFSKALCEANAEAEGAPNASFAKGDAVKLDFESEHFDAVTSNYVYHNIPSSDRRQLLAETLRVLKKGGRFAIHDLMSAARYGDMEAFVEDLKKQGYEKVELIDTANGLFMQPIEAKLFLLSGSKLLVGKK